MKTSAEQHIESFQRVAGNLLEKMSIDKESIIVRPQFGRNISAIVESSGGKQLFIKTIVGSDSKIRFHRSISFSINQSSLPKTFHTPELYESDEQTFTAAYQVVANATKMSDLAQENRVADTQWRVIGSKLALLHAWKPNEPERICRKVSTLPPTLNSTLSLSLLECSSLGQIELWQLIQHDPELENALDILVRREYEPVPIHGDIRSDQLLESRNDIWVIDWEDFRLGDAARDLGSILGEICFQKLRFLVRRAGEGNREISEENVRLAGVQLIEEVKPSLRAFWEGYSQSIELKGRTELLDATIGYMGWQMFDRVMSIGSFIGRITDFEKALAGIGRQMIIHRGSYASVLGLGGSIAR